MKTTPTAAILRGALVRPPLCPAHHRLTSSQATTAKKQAADPSRQRLRRVVLTGAVALITAVGAISGARLKSDHEETVKRQEIRELSLDERIQMLEERRAALVALKMPLERKLARVQGRIAEGEAEEGERGLKKVR